MQPYGLAETESKHTASRNSHRKKRLTTPETPPLKKETSNTDWRKRRVATLFLSITKHTERSEGYDHEI